MVVFVKPVDASRLKEYQLPKQIMLAEDTDGNLLQEFAKNLKTPLIDFQVVTIINTRQEGILLTRGCQIGLGDRLLQTLAGFQY